MEEKINFMILKPGDIFQGKKIKTIYASSDNYIFFRKRWHDQLSVQWHEIDETCLNPINPMISEIIGLIDKKNQKKYNYQITSAYIQCINNHSQSAIEILEKLKVQINREIIQQSKIRYLFFSIIFLLFNTFLSIILFYNKNIYDFGPFKEYFTVATFGSYGGFISILYKINKLNFEEESEKKLLFFLAISRCFIAMLSSIIIYVLIKSNILLGVLNDVKNMYVFYIFSVVAGFSETFVPDLLSKVENSTSE